MLSKRIGSEYTTHSSCSVLLVKLLVILLVTGHNYNYVVLYLVWIGPVVMVI